MIGNALPLHGNPMRVAEEIAMLDVISGGRIISGFVRGTGNEYHSYGVDPSTSRDRFWEAHDLIVKAWTEPGPFAWDGKYFHLPYVNPWPRPLQQPHPPIWLPGFASLETIDEAAKRHYTFMQVFSPRSVLKKALDTYRRLAEEKYGYEAKREQLGAAIVIYVAETDEQAHREARPHVTWLFREGLKHPPYFAIPPGYQSKAVVQELPRHDHREGHPGHLRPHLRLPDRARVRDRRLARHGDRAADEAHRRARHGCRHGRGRAVGRHAALDGDEEHDADGRGGDAALPRARTASRCGRRRSGWASTP